MVDSLAHRGRDGSGLWLNGSIGLGHQMLWTTPESLHEKQPLQSLDGNLTLTADARIDNRDELIPILFQVANGSRVISDGEVILQAYKRWGEDCAEKLVGDFAFVIWDNLRHTLFCARDPMGLKPFYYYSSPKLFVFASEIKAIFRVEEIPQRINELRIADHIVQLFEDKAITYYQGILRLEPAHSLLVDAEKIISSKYWSLDPSREIRLGSDMEYVEAFREHFTEAVRCRLRSAYEIGTTLSGGLDSSSIACVAQELISDQGNRRLKTYSAIFPNLPKEDLDQIDERFFIEAVLAKGVFQPTFVQADELSPLVDFERILWHQDEPFLAPNLYMHWALYRAAQNDGVRIFLDGIDGDVTISYGLDFLADLARSGRWGKLLHESRALSEKPGVAISPRKILFRYGIKPLVPQSIFTSWNYLKNKERISVFANTGINREFREKDRN